MTVIDLDGTVPVAPAPSPGQAASRPASLPDPSLLDPSPVSVEVAASMEEYLQRRDWRVSANANQGYSLHGPVATRRPSGCPRDYRPYLRDRSGQSSTPPASTAQMSCRPQ